MTSRFPPLFYEKPGPPLLRSEGPGTGFPVWVTGHMYLQIRSEKPAGSSTGMPAMSRACPYRSFA